MSALPKLWVVTISADIVVVAHDAQQAEDAAEDARRSRDVDDWEQIAAPLTWMPGGWNANCIPFGVRADGDPDRTIKRWRELIAAEEAEEKRVAEFNARQVPLPLKEPV